jgi:hypothetical protein
MSCMSLMPVSNSVDRSPIAGCPFFFKWLLHHLHSKTNKKRGQLVSPNPRAPANDPPATAHRSRSVSNVFVYLVNVFCCVAIHACEK